MTLKKAIELLKDYKRRRSASHQDDFQDAFELGIQAMSLIQLLRQYPNNLAWGKLPGET